MNTRIHCLSCLRAEDWSGEQRTVVVEGGRRKPAEHPQLAAWNTVKASLRGEIGPVVGPCPACDQPLVADGDLPAHPWTVELPDGPVQVHSADQIPALEPKLKAAFAEKIRPVEAVFGGAVLTAMTAPVLLWATAFFIVMWFLYNILLGTVGM